MSKKSDPLVEMHLDNIFVDIFKDSGWSDDAINAWGEARVKEYNRVPTEEETNAADRIGAEKTIAWAKRNPWYQEGTAKSFVAFRIHQVLIAQGFDPKSDEYYQELDRRLEESDDD